MNKVQVLNGEAQEAQLEIQLLKEEFENKVKVLKAKTKGMTISVREVKQAESTEVSRFVSIKGVTRKPLNFYPEHILKLVADTEEAAANRKAILEFIVNNKQDLSWK